MTHFTWDYTTYGCNYTWSYGPAQSFTTTGSAVNVYNITYNVPPNEEPPPAGVREPRRPAPSGPETTV